MSTTLTSSKAKVRNPKKVREILYSYDWDDFEIKLEKEDTGWTLEVVSYEDNFDAIMWPRAVKIEDLPDKDDYPDEDAYFDAEFEVYCDKGDEGFLALLQELAPHLESPLLILALEANTDFYPIAEVWRVEPGGKEVENMAV
jgi:hypothetical protein